MSKKLEPLHLSESKLKELQTQLVSVDPNLRGQHAHVRRYSARGRASLLGKLDLLSMLG
jgi:hypothetical protein